MTKEERKKAIKVLDDMKVKIDIPKAAKTQNDRNWALDVAIQALSQEPCDDAISRDAVFDGLKGCICEEWVKTLFATMVKQLPPVTQKTVFDEITAEIYEHFMTIDGKVYDKSAIKCMEIISKYK